MGQTVGVYPRNITLKTGKEVFHSISLTRIVRKGVSLTFIYFGQKKEGYNGD